MIIRLQAIRVMLGRVLHYDADNRGKDLSPIPASRSRVARAVAMAPPGGNQAINTRKGKLCAWWPAARASGQAGAEAGVLGGGGSALVRIL